MIADLLAKSIPCGGVAALPLSAFARFEQLFDHLPETVFYLKDAQGRYLAVNQTLVRRCGLREKGELLHHHVLDVFPGELAERYAVQDQQVLRRGVPIIERLELHWYERRRLGWCLTTKLPLRNEAGAVVGLIGISRDLRMLDDPETVPPGLAATLEHLESHFADPVSPASLASHAGMSSVRFARLVKRIYGVTPHELIIQTRLAAAARLLTETSRSVSEIALDCGFYDHSAFTRAFRSAANLTPSQFRAARSFSATCRPDNARLAAHLRYSAGSDSIRDNQ